MPLTNHEISYLTREQVAALLAVIDSVRNRAIWTVAYWRGLRVSEVGLLQFADWRDSTGRLFVRRLKGSNSGEYMVSPEEIKAIRAWLKVRGSDPGPLFASHCGGRPISRQRLHNLMRKYCGEAGIGAPTNHFHVMRHSIAVHLADKGIDIAVIQDWLGHKDISSTMIYVRITNANRNRAAEIMYKPDTDPEKPRGPRVNWAKDKIKRKAS